VIKRQIMMFRRAKLVSILSCSVLWFVSACGSTRARDVAGDRPPRGMRNPATLASDASTEGPSIPPPPQAVASTPSVRPRVLVRASARAIAVDDTHLYYGDNAQDGVFALPKAGGEPTRIARRAPVAGALVLDQGALAWVASPGDVVFRVNVHDGSVTTLQDKGIFSDVAAIAGETFVAEVLGPGGAILKGSGGTSTHLATLDASPRAIVVDEANVFVATPSKLLRVSRAHGEITTLAEGAGFESPQLDENFVYFVTSIPSGRILARVRKTGETVGNLTVVASNVRDAPIDVTNGQIVYIAGARPELCAVPSDGGTCRVIAEDDSLAYVTSIAVDETTVYTATGGVSEGAILAIPINYSLDRRR